MKSTQRMLLIFAIVCLIFIPISSYKETYHDQQCLTSNKSEKKDSEISYMNHSSIYISKNEELEVFPGNGTELDPYRIENFNITTSSDYGIYITNVSKHLIIQNCYISARNWSISLNDIADNIAIIFNNTCIDSFYGGILIWSSHGVRILDNICTLTGGEEYRAGIGIDCHISDNLILKNNICSFNNRSGISLLSCDYTLAENNTCSGSGYEFFYDSIYTYGGTGFSTSYCYKSVIKNNVFVNNDASGFSVRNTQDSIISNNTCEENSNGMYIDDSIYSSINNNTVLENSHGITIQDSSYLTVEGNNITYNSKSSLLIKESKDFLLNNNTLKQNSIGMEVNGDCRDHIITNNSIISNHDYGIILSGSDNLIYGNWFIENALWTEYSSQAFDSGVNNSWYDRDKEKGNFWSDLDSRCYYQIDGSSESEDIYPINAQSECEISWLSQIQKTSVIVLASILGVFSISFVVLSILKKK